MGDLVWVRIFFPAKPLAIELNFFFRDKQMCKFFFHIKSHERNFFQCGIFFLRYFLKKNLSPQNYSVFVFLLLLLFFF